MSTGRPVAPALDGVRVGRCQQVARLVVADRRRLAFAAFGPRPLDAFDGVVGDGVLLAEIFEQRGRRRRIVAPPSPRRRSSSRQVIRCARGYGAKLRAIRAGTGQADRTHATTPHDKRFKATIL